VRMDSVTADALAYLAFVLIGVGWLVVRRRG
jgi:uncharacterized protein (TIGR03382 family)